MCFNPFRPTLRSCGTKLAITVDNHESNDVIRTLGQHVRSRNLGLGK